MVTWLETITWLALMDLSPEKKDGNWGLGGGSGGRGWI